MNSALPIRLSRRGLVYYTNFRKVDTIPVLDPSSITRQTIVPSLMMSPEWAGTKLMGRFGIANALKAASSSMLEMAGSNCRA